MKYSIISLLAASMFAATAAAAPAGSLQLNQAPGLGETIIVSGNCSPATSGLVSFSLAQNSSNYVLASVNNQTLTNGIFNAAASIPANIQTGPATLMAACPNGIQLSSLVLLDPSAVLPDGSIIKASGPTVYLIFGGRKYGIPTLQMFYQLGLSFAYLNLVSDQTLQTYPDGGNI
jgi:hypothetical protein